jgi:hypothetical protein
MAFNLQLNTASSNRLDIVLSSNTNTQNTKHIFGLIRINKTNSDHIFGKIFINQFNRQQTYGKINIQKYVLRPYSDVVTDYWTNVPLYSKINEVSPDDTNKITSYSIPTGGYSEVKLTPTGQAISYNDHVIRYRYRKNKSSTNQLNLTVGLYCGSNLIKSSTHTDIDNNWIISGFTLSTGEAYNITDYSDLRLRFMASGIYNLLVDESILINP